MIGALLAGNSAGVLRIEPAQLTLTTASTMRFSASGGTAPYVFSAIGSGTVGAASGTYTPGGIGIDVVRATDATGATSDATITVVAAGPLAIAPSSATVAVTSTLNLAASGGTPPYNYTIASGSGTVSSSTGSYVAPASPGIATVRVTDALGATASANLTIDGAGCGQAFAESEPNDSTAPPWTSIDDFGLTFAPGCEVTITGSMDALGDTFPFNTGSATRIAIIVQWNSGADDIRFRLRTNGGTEVLFAAAANPDIESEIWIVTNSGAVRYLSLEQVGGAVSYTLTLDAD